MSRAQWVARITDRSFVDELLPVRPRDSHKGDYGKVLLLCGSRGLTGAAVMAAKAALRTGSGLVYLGVPEAVYPIVAARAMFFYQLESEGKAGAERDGLYWNVHASCPARAGLHRLYADNGEETVCLGVMILERDKLCLRRRLSDRSFSFTGETTIYLDGKADSERSGQTCAEQPPKAEGGRLTILYREGEAFVMKIRVFFAVLSCKLSRAMIRILGRGGTDFPGRIALKICPNLLGVLAKNVTTLIVTGTNGKTTTSRMIEQSWLESGISYFANKSGANLLSGVTAEFAVHSTLGGKCRYTHD